MRRAAVAQRILAIATTPDRAAAVVGDLLEEEPSRGRPWFWLTVARTTLAFVWLDFVRLVSGRHPVFSGAADIMGEIMDVGRFVWSRKRLVVIPVVLFTTVTSLVAYSMPVRYRAETLIMVVPQRVPEAYVTPTVNTQIEERLQMISQQILSRSRLERIIQEFNLYKEERKTDTLENVIERMRSRDVRIEIKSSPRTDRDAARAFSVSFKSTQPKTALQVADRLATLFVQENLEDGALLADSTNQFLTSQISQLAKEVDEFAARIEQAQHRTPPRSLVLEYEELQNTYRALLAKREDARLALNLERRQIGEQFKILDSARLPIRPEGPDRLSVSLFGATAGLGLGLVLMLASAMCRPPAAPAVIPPA